MFSPIADPNSGLILSAQGRAIVCAPRGKGYDQTDWSIRIGLSRRWTPRHTGTNYELKNMPARCLHA